VLIDGHDVRDLTLSSLRASVGLVLQDSLIFRTTVLGDRVWLLGSRPQSEVVDQLAAAETFALAPVVLADGGRDGIPNVLLEAMAVGVPVVATSVSGIPEVVTHGETGLLVPPRRPDLLADALAHLLGDPAARTRLGEGGRRLIHEHASWTSAIAPLHALLEGELARPTREPKELTVSRPG
jgi:glycosyltransferase involved in cell wall biosynthesis